jgi:hypothetical protein
MNFTSRITLVKIDLLHVDANQKGAVGVENFITVWPPLYNGFYLFKFSIAQLLTYCCLLYFQSKLIRDKEIFNYHHLDSL